MKLDNKNMSENPKQKIKRKQRDERIVELYPDLTLQEIGDMYNITKERVRQILKVENKTKNYENLNNHLNSN